MRTRSDCEGSTAPERTPRSFVGIVALLSILLLLQCAAGFAANRNAPEGRNAPPVAVDSVRTVAILLFEGAELLDVAGPAEVFIVAAEGKAFRVIMVAESTAPLHTMGGVNITPDYGFAEAPRADVIVVPGGDMQNISERGMQWLRTASEKAEIVMSVCMGAFVLARAGMLDGIEATTHHWGVDRLEKLVPGCKVLRDRRFVDSGKIITTAGVTAGIDGALHVVGRLLGSEAEHWTAVEWMEHRGGGATEPALVNGERDRSSPLAKLAFITGRWRGEMKGSVIEESWSVAEGDNMMGMFRLVKEGEGVFYEFMTIEIARDTPVLRIRHFSQGLVAWEEKDNIDEYPLVELTASRAVFENEDSGMRLVYECPTAEVLTITLETTKEGKKSQTVFSFHRAP
ncbi:MAG: DJ-1/PfpI family protein [Bacteroidetes bacterium]|nr:DJ-1/PfpI family protein [Bacteroidota bacterium]